MGLSTLKSLQTRIRESKGADRELDAKIALALGVIERFDDYWFDGKYDAGGYRRPGVKGFDFLAWSSTWPYSPFCADLKPDWEAWKKVAEQLKIPHYTADPDGLGACVGLMREVLPGCEWYCDRDHLFWVYRDFNLITEHRISGEKCINDCLTFLDAICAAKIAELEAQEKVG